MLSQQTLHYTRSKPAPDTAPFPTQFVSQCWCVLVHAGYKNASLSITNAHLVPAVLIHDLTNGYRDGDGTLRLPAHSREINGPNLVECWKQGV